MENLDTSFDEFFGAFEGEDGNQTDTVEETAETESADKPTEEPATEPQDAPDGADNPEEDTEEEAEADGAEGNDKDDGGTEEPKFISVKYDKETRQVSMEDAPGWIQKGMNYDRVKEQLDTERQSKQELQIRLDSQKDIMDTLNLISEQTKIPIADLLESMHINAVKKEGQTEAEVRAQIRADKLQRQLNAKNEQQTKQQEAEEELSTRFERELREFKQMFPGVKVDEELAKKLGPDIQAGMSMTAAYLKQENARQAAEIERLNQEKERSRKVDAQNKKNQTKAPGSQRDAGGQRSRDAFDDFFDAFEK